MSHPSSSSHRPSATENTPNIQELGVSKALDTISHRMAEMESNHRDRSEKLEKELKEVKGLLTTLIHLFTSGENLHPLAQRVIDEVDGAVVEAMVDVEPLPAPVYPEPVRDSGHTNFPQAPTTLAQPSERNDLRHHVPQSATPCRPQAPPVSAFPNTFLRRETPWDQSIRTERDWRSTSSMDLSVSFSAAAAASRDHTIRGVVANTENQGIATDLAASATPSRPLSASLNKASLPSPTQTPSPAVQTTTLPVTSPAQRRSISLFAASSSKKRSFDEDSVEEVVAKRRKSVRIAEATDAPIEQARNSKSPSPALSTSASKGSRSKGSGTRASALKSKSKFSRSASQFL
ncbi:hypothetical protein OF83DRAFT_320714 [Amylostereum chailletii]|nr:hypothetical protein OF83DRAFT_320714 [Amylostereum chailletii]